MSEVCRQYVVECPKEKSGTCRSLKETRTKVEGLKDVIAVESRLVAHGSEVFGSDSCGWRDANCVFYSEENLCRVPMMSRFKDEVALVPDRCSGPMLSSRWLVSEFPSHPLLR